MRNAPTLPKTPRHQSPTDGWLGTPGLPGYRAGNVVARLDDLPEVYPDHLYFHLVLLDAGGQLQDNHSGPCYALTRQQPLDARSRFVRVVAELVRHAPSAERGLSAIGQALTFVRERGIEFDCLVLAAQLLDDVCSESAVAASLTHLLELSLGADEARHVIRDVVVDLARRSGLDAPDAVGAPAPPAEVDGRADRMNGGDLAAQVAYVVRSVGKSRARRYLREFIVFELVPTPHLLGV